MLKATAAILTILILTACSTTNGTVIPKISGGEAIGTGYDETDAIKRAVATASDHCEKSGKTLAVTSRETTYKGMLAEDTRQTVDTVQAMATYAGLWLPTPNGEDYKATVIFDCL